ncbi:hypothetical protein P154DRAFT_616530 [Amniculicola lignicola CBS 123094]|uniref:Uncharacterized protein n=1 Tax=Amniculicola lignicola CBS 123094 TaxID=1392246 RepID=A0A6A5WX27_9PLEO|nr:hypothetical protein P154DRAFT_616530 [Amniculicola lignicola CBS 123094]
MTGQRRRSQYQNSSPRAPVQVGVSCSVSLLVDEGRGGKRRQRTWAGFQRRSTVAPVKGNWAGGPGTRSPEILAAQCARESAKDAGTAAAGDSGRRRLKRAQGSRDCAGEGEQRRTSVRCNDRQQAGSEWQSGTRAVRLCTQKDGVAGQGDRRRSTAASESRPGRVDAILWLAKNIRGDLSDDDAVIEARRYSVPALLFQLPLRAATTAWTAWTASIAVALCAQQLCLAAVYPPVMRRPPSHRAALPLSSSSMAEAAQYRHSSDQPHRAPLCRLHYFLFLSTGVRQSNHLTALSHLHTLTSRYLIIALFLRRLPSPVALYLSSSCMWASICRARRLSSSSLLLNVCNVARPEPHIMSYPRTASPTLPFFATLPFTNHHSRVSPLDHCIARRSDIWLHRNFSYPTQPLPDRLSGDEDPASPSR